MLSETRLGSSFTHQHLTIRHSQQINKHPERSTHTPNNQLTPHKINTQQDQHTSATPFLNPRMRLKHTASRNSSRIFFTHQNLTITHPQQTSTQPPFYNPRVRIRRTLSRNSSCILLTHQHLTIGWSRPINCLKLQVIFGKRATKNRAPCQKMTYNDKASCASLPPCMSHTQHRSTDAPKDDQTSTAPLLNPRVQAKSEAALSFRDSSLGDSSF